MDDRRFDSLVKSLAGGTNRRSVLKGFLGLGVAVASGTAVSSADAARRPTPTPKPVTCPGQLVWNGSACACPGGNTQCGVDCCPNGVATCCDNACCYGVCYSEELCCDPASWCDATGECCGPNEVCCGTLGCIAPGEVECCFSSECGTNQFCNADNECVCDDDAVQCEQGCVVGNCCSNGDCDGGVCIDNSCCTPNCPAGTCGDDGCGGTCGCPDGKVCSGGGCFSPCAYNGQGGYYCPDSCAAGLCLSFAGDDIAYCVSNDLLGACDAGCDDGQYCVHQYCARPCG